MQNVGHLMRSFATLLVVATMACATSAQLTGTWRQELERFPLEKGMTVYRVGSGNAYSGARTVEFQHRAGETVILRYPASDELPRSADGECWQRIKDAVAESGFWKLDPSAGDDRILRDGSLVMDSSSVSIEGRTASEYRRFYLPERADGEEATALDRLGSVLLGLGWGGVPCPTRQDEGMATTAPD